MAGQSKSYWNETADVPEFPQLVGDIKADVAIVGGGLVGVTAARLLKSQGMKVAVIEARKVGQQVTGKSTAKITSQHGIRYQTLAQKFGENHARLYAEAQEAGIRRMRELAAEHGIEADIETKPAYVYTTEESYVQQIEKEVEIAQRLGLPASLTRETDLPFDVRIAMRWDGQAQFHPVKFVAGLAATIPGDNSSVFEGSRVTDWEPTRVTTAQGSVTAQKVVMATHLPLGQIGFYYAMAYPKAEPVVAAPIGRVPSGMYLSAEDPTRSIRTHLHNGKVYAIAVGASFKPGHTDDEQEHIQEIERWLADHFEAAPAEYRWINEDYTPMDGAPFIGWSSSSGDRYLVATGFNAWGISTSTAAGMIISDLALERENKWLPIFDATRVKPVAGAKEFVSENAQVATHLASGYLSRKLKSYDDLDAGSAAILDVDGERVAAFKDEGGVVHAVSAKCTHMGCDVGWNATDRTWDCACHGSRFEISGDVIHGPAVAPLERKKP